MSRKIISIVVLALTFLMIVPNAFAWTYPWGEEDKKFETFGPRADQLLIKLYADELSEWETGVEGREIDVTDWPLDKAHKDEYELNPALKVLGYGAEFGLFIFDLNNNNNTYLGNPPKPQYPNPVYPNPMGYSVDESGILKDDGWWLRAAIAYLTDRDAIVSYVGAETATAIYTPVPPSMGKYSHPDIKPGGALEDLCYLYNPEEASRLLNESGFFPFGSDGWRFWDRNKNGQKDSGEDLVLKVFGRSDHPPRLKAAELLVQELQGPGIKIHVNFVQADISAARIQVMANKNFHVYTGGWSLGIDPDHLVLWNWEFYWHPGRPYNYAGCNKDAFNDATYPGGIYSPNTQDEAVYYAYVAQEVFAEAVLSVPLWSATGYKVMSKTYVGAEPEYQGEKWYGVVNWPGYGIDNGYTFLNMHTSCHEYGGVIRYGMKTPDLRQLNPIYTEWLWENTVLDLIGWESLLARDPYTLSFIPWVAKNFTVGTYEHPVYGTCTKVVFTLRDDVYFQDGEKLTIADIYYTFVEMDDDLEAQGYPPPWWISNVANILSFSILDPLNFEVLLDLKSIFAIGWVGGNRILPKHIYKPICTGQPRPKDGQPYDPTTFAPDPNLVGSGPWRLAEYVANSHVKLVANVPGSTVKTNIVDPNADPTYVTSPMGFFRLKPKYVNIHADKYQTKIILTDPAQKWTLVNLTVVDHNLMQESFRFDFDAHFVPNNPVGAFLYFRMPDEPECNWTIIDWIDQNSTGMLDACDLIQVNRTCPPDGRPIWLHVQSIGPLQPIPDPPPIWQYYPPVDCSLTLIVGQVLEADKWVWIDDTPLVEDGHEYEKPCIPIIEEFTVNLTRGRHTAYVAKHIKTEWLLCKNNDLVPNPYYCTWINVTWPIWITIKEDIGGSYYINPQLPAPDLKVDIKDVAIASKAFGTYPGHEYWNTIADTNGDYKVDIKDVAAISKRFGWAG